MALDAGDAREGTGLAGLMAEKLKEIEKKFDVKNGYHMLDAIAQAVVEHVEQSMALDDLSDVTITNPVVGEQLTFTGSEWENAPDQVDPAP